MKGSCPGLSVRVPQMHMLKSGAQGDRVISVGPWGGDWGPPGGIGAPISPLPGEGTGRSRSLTGKRPSQNPPGGTLIWDLQGQTRQKYVSAVHEPVGLVCGVCRSIASYDRSPSGQGRPGSRVPIPVTSS